MRAVVCRQHGPPEVVTVEDMPPPALVERKVRVRVRAASVNFPDVLVVAGDYQLRVATPFIPGSDFAGVVAEVGGGVDGLVVGDRVSGMGLYGAFAEEAVVAARGLTRIPDGVDDRSAAAFGVGHRTAYHALRSVARIQSGDEVIVLGAGGGVGLAAVQLGTVLGASVTAVASSAEKLAAAKAAGARVLIDHRAGDLRQSLREAHPDGAAAVLDPVGGDLSAPALRSLRRGGRFVTIGYASGVIPRIPLNLVLVKGIEVHGLQLQDLARKEEFQRVEIELSDLLATGRALPHIGATYPLEQAATALRHVADGHAIGKVVLDL